MDLRGEIYRITYTFNSYDGALVVTILRTRDDKDVWIGRVIPTYPYVPRDPDSGIPLWGFVALSVVKTNIDIWVIHPDWIPTFTLEGFP